MITGHHWIVVTCLGVTEVAGVGGAAVAHTGRGVDVSQEGPCPGQGHVDNKTRLKNF